MEAVREMIEVEQEIIDEFELFDDWSDRYEHLINEGKSLPLIDTIYKDEDHLVKGCQSLVWLHADHGNERMHYTADSDAIITKGMIALLLRVLNDRTPDEIINAKLAFIDRINLKEHLSPGRANGLVSMLRKIKIYALAFKTTNHQT
ncbi:MAG: SufE family protein [Chitinophagales bacterium]|nr:SufE family protein [Chitinophagales bacterium]